MIAAAFADPGTIPLLYFVVLIVIFISTSIVDTDSFLFLSRLRWPFSRYVSSSKTSLLLVQFDYDNGVGSSVDRFAIDLYKAEGSGDCGTWVASICDKESIGCKDSSEY